MADPTNLAAPYIQRGNLLLAQSDLDGADDAFNQAIAAAPKYGPTHNGRGVVRHRKHDLDGALSAFQEAVRLDPNYAEAADNLGIVLRELGDLSQARQCFLRAIALEPENGGYLRHLADTGPVAPGDSLIEQIERVVAIRDRLPLASRVEALFAYAKVLADLEHHDEAFAALHEANELRRGTIGYDERPLLQSFDMLAKTFTPQFVSATKGSGDPSRRPIFIVGMPRSGTTLVEAIVASHRQVRAGGELTALERGIVAMPAVRPRALIGELRSALHALGTAYIAQTDATANGSQHLTDKMPFNFRFLPLIAAALPNAKIIHVRRSPLDVAYSCFATYFVDSVPFAYDLGELGRYYRAYEGLMSTWQKVLPPGSILDVEYEQVVGDFETQARRMLAFCGLAWDEAVLRFHEARHPVRSASHSQVRRPLYTTSAGRASAIADKLQPFEEARTGT